MQIKDWLNHYDNAATQAKPITVNKGVEKLTSSIEGLSKGNIFEGTVSSIKGGKVILALSNGQTISARLDGKMLLQVGQSMFFQVKSNNGKQVEIRPYNAQGSGNPTLLQALKAANLPITPEFIDMVNKMMEEKMPIDKVSVSSMARIILNNPDISVNTLVQLEKFSLPIDMETATQFENYLNDRQAINREMELFMDELPNVMSDDILNNEQLKKIGHDLINIVTENLEELPEGSSQIVSRLEIADDTFVNTLDFDDVMMALEQGASEAEVENVIQELTQNTSVESPESLQVLAEESPQEAVSDDTNVISDGIKQEIVSDDRRLISDGIKQEIVSDDRQLFSEQVHQGSGQDQVKVEISIKNTVGSIMQDAEMMTFSKVLKETFPELEINKNTSVVSVLNEIAKQINENPQIDRTKIIKLFSSDGFKAMIKDSLSQKWMIEPNEVSQKDKMDKLYDEVKTHIEKMENIIKDNGVSNSAFTNAANTIKSNVEFMNQINQAYTYIQMPLKMSGQNASGQLYVYTNKKNINDPDQELSAFLHLDMEHLGSTDVSVKMLKKNVTTNFYFENDATFDLIEKFLPMLEDRLKEKGYNCKFNVENEKKNINFVDDFLKKDQPGSGKLSRYSFDMRA